MSNYAPELNVSEWLQGPEVKLSELKGNNPIYLHFFQANCPGCFSSSLPFAEKLHREYSSKGLKVIGVASRFEEWEENSRKNFEDFINYGKLTTKVKGQLSTFYGDQFLNSDNTYKIKIQHPIAWDEGKDGEYSKTWSKYNCMGTPYEVLINKEGKVLDANFHLENSPKLKEVLKSL